MNTHISAELERCAQQKKLAQDLIACRKATDSYLQEANVLRQKFDDFWGDGTTYYDTQSTMSYDDTTYSRPFNIDTIISDLMQFDPSESLSTTSTCDDSETIPTYNLSTVQREQLLNSVTQGTNADLLNVIRQLYPN